MFTTNQDGNFMPSNHKKIIKIQICDIDKHLKNTQQTTNQSFKQTMRNISLR